MHRRRHGRIRTPGVTANLHRGGEILAGLAVENLSMGGAFVRTARPFHEASAVGIVLVAPGANRSIRLTGRVVTVVREHGGGMGLCFDRYPQETASALRALLMRHAPGPMVLDGDTAAEPVREAGEAMENAPPDGRGGRPNTSAARLAVQVKWLLLELSDWRAQASMLQTRNQSLQVEVEQLLAALQQVVR